MAKWGQSEGLKWGQGVGVKWGTWLVSKSITVNLIDNTVEVHLANN